MAVARPVPFGRCSLTLNSPIGTVPSPRPTPDPPLSPPTCSILYRQIPYLSTIIHPPCTIYTTNSPRPINTTRFSPLPPFLPFNSPLIQKQANRPVVPTPSSSNALFLPNAQDSVLSPQEREIMADITLDPDDPATWSRAEAENDKDASASAFNINSVDASANMFQVSKPPHNFSPALPRGLVINLFFVPLHGNPFKQSRSPSVTAASQRHLIPVVPTQAPPPPRLPQPAPPAVASTSSSVSPSPFAPRASIASPFSKSSSSPPSHPAAATKEAPDMDRVHTDRLAVTGELGSHCGEQKHNGARDRVARRT